MNLFSGLPATLRRIYGGKNLILQISAAALTALVVLSGLDWAYFEKTRWIPWQAVMPAVALGTVMPVILPLALLAFGALRKNGRLLAAGWASGQAAILGFVVSSVYKVFTGRMPPPWERASAVGALTDTSRGFQFGFLRGGAFWGWPSSHTTVAFAIGAALFALFPERPILRWAGLAWALYVGLSVSMSIHWFSEFAAGAIIGSIIGAAVGRTFRSLKA